MTQKIIRSATVFIIMTITCAMVFAQDMSPEVTVEDQFVYSDTVVIDSVVSEDLGFIVIHADNGSGQPGPVIGYRSLSPGENTSVVVPLDIANVTPTLFAMLHTDTGELGVYEFGSVEGADAPVIVDDAPLTQAFAVEVISMSDQIVGDSNTVTANVISTQQDGWLVVHANSGSDTPGAVLGYTFVAAGTTTDVMVELDGEVTSALYPMLHVDTGEAELYEFGSVEGADTPVQIGDRTAVTSLLTVPTIRASDQIVIGSDATANNEAQSVLRLDNVLSDGVGWLVVHKANEDGNPGDVIGFAALQDGNNAHVVVELNTADVTPVVFPMLHEDTGEELVYEFGEVEGADGPVTVDGEVVVVPVNVAPTIHYAGSIRDNILTIDMALIDGPGWLVIHANNDGAPGEVIGFAPLLYGVNTDVMIELVEGASTGTVFPMLHYDNNEQGVYEFGEVEGADGPVIVNGNVVVGALNPANFE